jgi:hypothetical protein
MAAKSKSRIQAGIYISVEFSICAEISAELLAAGLNLPNLLWHKGPLQKSGKIASLREFPSKLVFFTKGTTTPA